MNKIDRLFKKAMQGAKDRRRREKLAQGVEYMGVWADAMAYCYNNRVEIPKDQKGRIEAFRHALKACGHEEQAADFLEWYLDGGEGLVYGDTAENADADGSTSDAGKGGQYDIK